MILDITNPPSVPLLQAAMDILPEVSPDTSSLMNLLEQIYARSDSLPEVDEVPTPAQVTVADAILEYAFKYNNVPDLTRAYVWAANVIRKQRDHLQRYVDRIQDAKSAYTEALVHSSSQL